MWEEPEHSTTYRGCEITLSTRKSYEYSEEIQAHEKALSEAKMRERYNGTAHVIRFTSFPVIKAMKRDAA